MKRLFDKILGKNEPTPVVQGETFTRGKKNRIAVYIDIDDASPEDIPFVMEAMQPEGHVFIKRYFASHKIDTTDDKWFNVLHQAGVKSSEIIQGSYFESRSADIALAIDTIHTMISADIDIFVLVSSDASFTPLVKTLKKYGKTVFVFGAASATDYFKASCDQFFEGDKPSQKEMRQQTTSGHSPIYEPTAIITPTVPAFESPTEAQSEPEVEPEEVAPLMESEEIQKLPEPVEEVVEPEEAQATPEFNAPDTTLADIPESVIEDTPESIHPSHSSLMRETWSEPEQDDEPLEEELLPSSKSEEILEEEPHQNPEKTLPPAPLHSQTNFIEETPEDLTEEVAAPKKTQQRSKKKKSNSQMELF